jgi:arabinose-5-phosphate isomerase
MTRKHLGGVAVADGGGRLLGAFTDGDLRRALPGATLSSPITDYMTTTPIFVAPNLLATEALRIMNDPARPILLIFVCDDGRLVGAAGVQDFLRAGVA